MSERNDFPSEHPDDNSTTSKTEAKRYTLAEIKVELDRAIADRKECQKRIDKWHDLDKVESRRLWDLVKNLSEGEIEEFVRNMPASDYTKQALVLALKAGVEHYERYY